MQSWWARLRGKEDPNAVIGAEGSHARITGDTIWALKDVSLDVRHGEAVGIVGRNGAGKTTFLKVLSPITAPTKGDARIRGRIASLLEVGTGFHPELTGRENVFLNGAILGMTIGEIKAKFDEIVDFSGIEKYIDTPVKRYSSGMAVRLAFAVAAHLEPEILLVDEVLAVGDAAFQNKGLGKMGEISRGGRTVLFVSHRMGAITTLCERAIWIHEGKLVCDGPAQQVVQQYLESCIPSPEVSEYRAQDNPGLPFQILRLSLIDAKGKPVAQTGLWEQLYVRLLAVVRQELQGAALSVSVARDGQPIFYSYDTDLCPERLGTRNSGLYEALVSLPLGLLPPGRYTLSATSAFGILTGGHQRGLQPDVVLDKISFDVVDQDGRGSVKSSACGVMASLNWEINPVTRAALE
jgi:lipopolysaccharide transport system ATP-binding protein